MTADGVSASVKAKVKTLDAPADELFVPPTLVRIGAIEDLDQEWFGPILHVATWEAGKLSETIARVNAKGYGLTMGLHSRIARAAEVIEAEAAVGNLYINRSMIGAVVGSQPFGGEGLSGTGPKAGGPRYLYRFCAERAVSVDTTRAGGNATLLSLDEGGIELLGRDRTAVAATIGYVHLPAEAGVQDWGTLLTTCCASLLRPRQLGPGLRRGGYGGRREFASGLAQQRWSRTRGDASRQAPRRRGEQSAALRRDSRRRGRERRLGRQ